MNDFWICECDAWLFPAIGGGTDPAFRWAGDHWQHHHGYPIGHVRMYEARALLDRCLAAERAKEEAEAARARADRWCKEDAAEIHELRDSLFAAQRDRDAAREDGVRGLDECREVLTWANSLPSTPNNNEWACRVLKIVRALEVRETLAAQPEKDNE